MTPFLFASQSGCAEACLNGRCRNRCKPEHSACKILFGSLRSPSMPSVHERLAQLRGDVQGAMGLSKPPSLPEMQAAMGLTAEDGASLPAQLDALCTAYYGDATPAAAPAA